MSRARKPFGLYIVVVFSTGKVRSKLTGEIQGYLAFYESVTTDRYTIHKEPNQSP